MDDHSEVRQIDEDDPVYYPENQVLAVLPTAEGLSEVIDALMESDVPASDISVLHGEATGDKLLESSGGRTGVANLMMRLVAAVGMPNDETVLKNRYASALHEGAFIIMVSAPDDARKKLVGDTIQEHGGRDVHFFGQLTIEALDRSVPPAPPER